MYYHSFRVVLQEVPNEISLCFSISGCPLHCKGCHSPHLWKDGSGKLLTIEEFKNILITYKKYATCVLFMGGEWHEKKLIKTLKIAKENNYKTCLYTGEKDVSSKIKHELTWLKTGSWNAILGGLQSKETNQLFIEVGTNTKLNHLFIKN